MHYSKKYCKHCEGTNSRGETTTDMDYDPLSRWLKRVHLSTNSRAHIPYGNGRQRIFGPLRSTDSPLQIPSDNELQRNFGHLRSIDTPLQIPSDNEPQRNFGDLWPMGELASPPVTDYVRNSPGASSRVPSDNEQQRNFGHLRSIDTPLKIPSDNEPQRNFGDLWPIGELASPPVTDYVRNSPGASSRVPSDNEQQINFGHLRSIDTPLQIPSDNEPQRNFGDLWPMGELASPPVTDYVRNSAGASSRVPSDNEQQRNVEYERPIAIRPPSYAERDPYELAEPPTYDHALYSAYLPSYQEVMQG